MPKVNVSIGKFCLFSVVAKNDRGTFSKTNLEGLKYDCTTTNFNLHRKGNKDNKGSFWFTSVKRANLKMTLFFFFFLKHWLVKFNSKFSWMEGPKVIYGIWETQVTLERHQFRQRLFSNKICFCIERKIKLMRTYFGP